MSEQEQKKEDLVPGESLRGLWIDSPGIDDNSSDLSVYFPDHYEGGSFFEDEISVSVEPHSEECLAPDPKPVKIDASSFPPLPQVAWKILSSTADLYRSAAGLEELILCDQALTTQVLRMANSAFFGLRKEVKTVRQAAVVLGNRRLRNLVMAACLGGVHTSSPYGHCLWEHALGVAITTEELARMCHFEDADQAFVAGLMHDIGKTLLDRQHPELFEKVVRLQSDQRLPSVEAEKRILGFDHTEVGWRLAEVWNLPGSLEEAIFFHHAPSQSGADTGLCALVSLADGLCLREGIGCRKNKIDVTQLQAFSILEVKLEGLDSLLEKVVSKLSEDKDLFGLC